MKRIKEVLREEVVSNVVKKGKCLIAELEKGKLVIKEKNNHNIKETYSYLESRNFDYFPKIIRDNSKYNIYEYIEEVDEPLEQKAFDMMNLLSLLHNKTTFYQEMDINEYKEIYENVNSLIDNTLNYYINLINLVETHMYMSPTEYLIARNISKIEGALNYSKRTINDWYDLINTKAKKRTVLLYNNIDLNHLIRNKDLYLLNWDKSRQGIPIYDLYNFYIKYALNFDFYDLLNHYQDKYTLTEDEIKLFTALISIPPIINFSNNEIDNCRKAKKIIDILYKSEVLISKIEDKE